MKNFRFFTKHIRKYEEIIQKWCICFAIRNFFGKVHFVAVIIFGNTSLAKSCGFHSSLNCQIQTDFPGKSGSKEDKGRGHENLKKVLNIYVVI